MIGKKITGPFIAFIPPRTWLVADLTNNRGGANLVRNMSLPHAPQVHAAWSALSLMQRGGQPWPWRGPKHARCVMLNPPNPMRMDFNWLSELLSHIVFLALLHTSLSYGTWHCSHERKMRRGP